MPCSLSSSHLAPGYAQLWEVRGWRVREGATQGTRTFRGHRGEQEFGKATFKAVMSSWADPGLQVQRSDSN